MPKLAPKVGLVAGGPLVVLPSLADFDYLVGVDRGSLTILEAGYPLALAVGDFDSVSPAELAQIKAQSDRVIEASPEKNHTDTELALLEIFGTWPQAQVSVFAGLGGRLDHGLANLFLPSEPALAPFMTQISLKDQQNLVCYLPAGQHRLEPIAGMSYVSFLPEGGRLTIAGAKYPLNASNFFSKKIYASNEFEGQPIDLTLDKGYLIVIFTRDGR